MAAFILALSLTASSQLYCIEQGHNVWLYVKQAHVHIHDPGRWAGQSRPLKNTGSIRHAPDNSIQTYPSRAAGKPLRCTAEKISAMQVR